MAVGVLLAEQGRSGYLQGVCQPSDIVYRDVSLCAFNEPHKGPMQSGQIGQGFLT